MKKISFILLTLLFTGTTFAWDYEKVLIDDLCYNLDDFSQSAEVTQHPDRYTGDIVIPQTVEYNSATYTVTKIGVRAFLHCDDLKSVNIPNTVTKIGSGAFYRCEDLKSVKIPNTITEISHHAFSFCSKLTAINIPNSIEKIGSLAFQDCKGLTNISIPGSVSVIDHSAFFGCSGLTAIEIPSSVTRIENEAFAECSGLTSITVASGNSTYDSRENCNAIIETKTNTLIAACKNTFIPNSVTAIGEAAFRGCCGLTDITIPNAITTIENDAFRDCTGLTNISIPGSVSIIDYSAFFGCSGLTAIEIPSSVTRIENEAFAECSGLTSITVASGNSTYDSRENCNAIIETKTNTLIAACKNTFIPNSVTAIGEAAFRGCTELTDIDIPNSVSKIGKSAFRYCAGLTSITVPIKVTNIEEYTFYGCSGLKSITLYASVPKTIDENVFRGDSKYPEVDKTTCILYVPTKSIDLYRAASVWKDFVNIHGVEVPQEDPEYIEEDYSIRYLDISSKELDRDIVLLRIPVAPEIENFTFLKWKVEEGDLENGITIQAIYEANDPSSTPDEVSVPGRQAQKLIRQGNVYILRDDRTYTLTGQEVK